MSILDQAARAIEDAMRHEISLPSAVYRDAAKRVLTAIRDPSEAMVNAAPDDRHIPIYSEDIWRAMIDAALADE